MRCLVDIQITQLHAIEADMISYFSAIRLFKGKGN